MESDEYLPWPDGRGFARFKRNDSGQNAFSSVDTSLVCIDSIEFQLIQAVALKYRFVDLGFTFWRCLMLRNAKSLQKVGMNHSLLLEYETT